MILWLEQILAFYPVGRGSPGALGVGMIAAP
jgi:hypothetical protein